jgi:hypothetical protein
MTLHDRLIEDWRSAWRFWSIRMQLAGTMISGLLVMVPAMPAEIQELVPLKYRVVAIGLWAVASIGARLIKQKPRA